MHERIKAYANREYGALPDEAALIAFGSDLFETLFDGAVRRLYDEARARQHGRPLDLILTSMVPWIAEKPWEFAYDTTRRSFLATEDIHFVRNVVTGIPADRIAPTPGPLRVLVVAAQPIGSGRLSLEQEQSVIRRGFEALVGAGLAEIRVLTRATPSTLHAALVEESFAIVHFIGHGRYDPDTRKGTLAFENEHGQAALLGQRAVREILCRRGVKLVFLNACQSGSGDRVDFNQGVAQALVAHGIPALVANQYSVLDTSATRFAQQFYRALAQGRSLGDAAREARIAVNYSIQGEIIDWAVPVLYARDPGLSLCDRLVVPARSQTHAGDVVRRPNRVSVWDIDNVFPGLDRLLARMNPAQSHFGFERVDLSMPLDVWDLEQSADRATPYLWAEKLAHRLGRMPLELQVDVLVCVTRQPMRNDEWLNLLGWWPEAGAAPIVIVSLAGFDSLPSEGALTQRVLGNLLVTALSGQLGRFAAHDHGPRDCPMSRSGNRDLGFLGRPHRFDPDCRKRLQARAPKALAALESLCEALD
jgi:hypothetical protein